MFFCAAGMLAVPEICVLPPALVAGGLVLARPAKAEDAAASSTRAGASEGRGATAPVAGPAAGSVVESAAERNAGSVVGPVTGENSVDDGALAAPLVLVSPIVRSEAVALRPALSHEAGLVLAGARARLQALRDAAEALPNRRHIRMGAVNAEERLALAAHLYEAADRHKPADTARPADKAFARAEVILEARPAAAASMSQILRSFDLMQMCLQLLRESTALLQLMNSRHVPGAALEAAPPNGTAAPNFGRSVFRAPVNLPHEEIHEEQRGNARKNSLDELFSGRAGTGMGPRRPPPAAAISPATDASPAQPDGQAPAPVLAPAPSASPASGAPPASGASAASGDPPAPGPAGPGQTLHGSATSANDAPQFALHVPAPPPALSDSVWTQDHWNLATRRLQALFDVQAMLASADSDGWLVRARDLPQLEQTARLVPDSPSVWLLLAEAQLRHDLPLQSVASCDAALDLDSGLSRARYIRALGHLRLQQLALAEADLTVSLARRQGLEPQGEDRARRLRVRGAVRMQRHDTAGMCEDFGAACALGDCEGLMQVRAQGQCLPAAIAEPQEIPPPASGGDSPAADQDVWSVPQKTETPLPGGKEKRK